MKRISSWVAAVGLAAGFLSSASASEIWYTGLWRYTIFNGAATNLGFSSGNIAATAPQRWLAQPFSLAHGQRIQSVSMFGFVPAAFGFSDVRVVFWTRTGTAAPVAANLVSDSTVPIADYLTFPDDVYTVFAPDPNFVVEIDCDPSSEDPNLFPAYRWVFNLPAPVSLAAGDYYLTVYGGTPIPGESGFSNLAWFANAPGITTAYPALPQYDDITFIDNNGVADAGQVEAEPYPYAWRSASFPAPGFGFYQVATATYSQDPINDPLEWEVNDLFRASFILTGDCLAAGSTGNHCSADLDADCSIGLGDLALLLASFGSSCGTDDNYNPNADYDLTSDIGLGDLAVLLGQFGDSCQ